MATYPNYTQLPSLSTSPQPSAPLGYSGYGGIADYGSYAPSSPMTAPAPGPAVPSVGSSIGANNFMPAAAPVAGLDSSQITMTSPGIAVAGSDALSQGLARSINTPQDRGILGSFTNADGSLNFGNLQHLASGIASLGGLWNSFQSNRIAREGLEFQRDAYNTNLENSISSYNTALEDRARTRYAQENRTQAEADEWVERNRLSR